MNVFAPNEGKAMANGRPPFYTEKGTDASYAAIFVHPVYDPLYLYPK
jgi:hypothetical protein